jgi:hypothetical protein
VRLPREPLLHFVLLGAAIFVVSAAVGDSSDTRTDRIDVSATQVRRLADTWERTWQRPPTRSELDALVEDHVREEVYYREALAMGLDRDDTIVRRRMRQKLEFLGEDVGDLVAPTDDDLQSFLSDNPDLFVVDPQYEFRHVYLSPDVRGPALVEDARRVLAQLTIAGPDADIDDLGDPLPLPRVFDGVEAHAVRRTLGEAFMTRLARLPTGEWTGPVESGFGLHVVLIEAKTEGRLPDLPEVREAVESEWRSAKRRESDNLLYAAMRSRYEISIEDAELITPDVSTPGGAE